jgi:hypothetical protein
MIQAATSPLQVSPTCTICPHAGPCVPFHGYSGHPPRSRPVLTCKSSNLLNSCRSYFIPGGHLLRVQQPNHIARGASTPRPRTRAATVSSAPWAKPTPSHTLIYPPLKVKRRHVKHGAAAVAHNGSGTREAHACRKEGCYSETGGPVAHHTTQPAVLVASTRCSRAQLKAPMRAHTSYPGTSPDSVSSHDTTRDDTTPSPYFASSFSLSSASLSRRLGVCGKH